MILDEPVSGLDDIVRQDFLESIVNVIQEEGQTVLMSSHLVHELERVADHVGILEGGKMIAQDTIDRVKGSVKQVTMGNEIETANLPAQDFALEKGQISTTVTIYDFDDDKLARLKAVGADVLEVTDLPLEQAFVAHVRRPTGGAA